MTGRNNNLSLALSLAAVVAGMVMMAYASVPLYRLFCQTTGLGGIAQPATTKPRAATDRHITVRFDANVAPALDWLFKPTVLGTDVKVGEQKHIEYQAQNLGNTASAGTATFNVTPVKAGIYFNKIQCFCFTEQKLLPHEKKRLDVTFFIDPTINDDRNLDDVHTITLSYTFFPVEK